MTPQEEKEIEDKIIKAGVDFDQLCELVRKKVLEDEHLASIAELQAQAKKEGFEIGAETALKDLSKVCREYEEKYPDATFHDFIGLIAGSLGALKQVINEDK